MINIARFFENHLANREISAEELRQFAEDHIGKLKALPALPANLTALLAPTDTAFGAFDEKLSDRTTYLAAQVGGTITKDEVLQVFRSTVRQREGRVRDKFPKGSAAYAEFYPQGLKDYNRARLGQLPALLDRYITAADKHKAALGPELLAELTALKTSFTTARESQVEAKGDLAHVRAALAAARVVLEMQLGKNILAIASHHLGQPERAADYFNQSLLEDPTRSNEEPVNPPPAG
jgi:tetratricopeptide (TPR) repeat protein